MNTKIQLANARPAKTTQQLDDYVTGTWLGLDGTAVAPRPLRAVARRAQQQTVGLRFIQPLQTILAPTKKRIAGPAPLPKLAATQPVTISQLRMFTGLTWEQLADLFGTSRRALHFWASGEEMANENYDHLCRLMETMKAIDRGSAAANRQALYDATDTGPTAFDLLKRKNYSAALRLVGNGIGRATVALAPLSATAVEARKPPRPEELIGALQDSVHKDVGRSRIAKSVKVRRGRTE